MHASVASSLIQRARLATTALALAAVGAVFVPLGLSESGTPSEAEATKPAADKPVGGKIPFKYSQFTSALDSAELAAHLNRTAPPVPVTKPKETVVAGGPEVVAAPPPPPPPMWRYIGSMILGPDRRAIVVVSERQQMVKVGDTVEGSRLTTIEPEFLMVTDAAGKEKRIDLAPRQTRALNVTETASRPPAPSAVPAAVAMGALGSDEATAVRIKDAAHLWAKHSERMSDPAVRERIAKIGKILENEQVDPDGFNKLMDDLPRTPELAELHHQFSEGSIDREMFSKLASEAIRQQLDSQSGGSKGEKPARGRGK